MIERYKNRNINYDEVFNESIVLIGPMSTGKTTIAKELLKDSDISDKLTHLQFENVRYFYLDYFGYDRKHSLELMKEKKYEDAIKYRQLYTFKFVKKMLDGIDRPMLLEFGGGDTITSNDADKKELEECLGEFKNVVLLLPSPDPKVSLKILEERWDSSKRGEYEIGDFNDMVNWYILNNGVNEHLANITVYTEGKTPIEVAQEIKELINERKKTIL